MDIFVEFEKEAYQAAERIGLKCAVKAYYNKELQYNAALFTFAAGGGLVQIETGFPEIYSSSCIKSWAKTCLIEAITITVNQEGPNTRDSESERALKKSTERLVMCSHCSKGKPATNNTEVGALCGDCYQDACDGGL